MLGLRGGDADELRDALLSAARVNEAVMGGQDEYEVRYVLDFDMSSEGGSARIRSSWIVRPGEDFPRQTS